MHISDQMKHASLYFSSVPPTNLYFYICQVPVNDWKKNSTALNSQKLCENQIRHTPDLSVTKYTIEHPVNLGPMMKSCN